MAENGQFTRLNDRDPDANTAGGQKDPASSHAYPDGGVYDELFAGTSSSQLTSAGTLMVSGMCR